MTLIVLTLLRLLLVSEWHRDVSESKLDTLFSLSRRICADEFADPFITCPFEFGFA